MSEQLSPEQHAADHAAWQELGPELREFLADRRRATERMEKIRGQVIGGAILALFGAIGSFLLWVGKLALEQLQQGKHP